METEARPSEIRAVVDRFVPQLTEQIRVESIPEKEVRLLAPDFPSCCCVLLPSDLQCEFSARVEEIGKSGDHFYVRLGRDASIQLQESLRKLITTALCQSGICRDEAAARDLIMDVITTPKYAQEPNTHPHFEDVRDDRQVPPDASPLAIAIEEVGIRIRKPGVLIRSIATWGFAIGAGLIERAFKSERARKTNGKHCQWVQRVCFKGTPTGMQQAYHDIIRPCLIAYAKIERITGRGSSLFIEWYRTRSYNPGFALILPDIPLDHKNRVPHYIQTMCDLIESRTTDSYTIYRHVSDTYQSFLKSVGVLKECERCATIIALEQAAKRATLDDDAWTRIGDTEQLSAIDKARILAAGMMKIAISGSGLDVQPFSLFGLPPNMNTTPCCSDSSGMFHIFLAETVRNINNDLTTQVQLRIANIGGLAAQVGIDFEHHFVASVDTYLLSEETRFQNAEDEFNRVLTSLGDELAEEAKSSMNELRDENERMSDTNEAFEWLKLIEKVTTTASGGFASVSLPGRVVIIAIDLLLRKRDIIRTALNASNTFKICRLKHERLSEVTQLMNWYKITSQLLTNPEVIAIEIKIRNGEFEYITGITLNY